MIAALLPFLGLGVPKFLTGPLKWLVDVGIILAMLAGLWALHGHWERAAYNAAYNAGVAKQKVQTDAEIRKNAVNLASINTLTTALADKNAESLARAKAYTDAKAADAATIADMDKRAKADASRLETLQRLARDLPDNPACRVPAALSAQTEGL